MIRRSRKIRSASKLNHGINLLARRDLSFVKDFLTVQNTGKSRAICDFLVSMAFLSDRFIYSAGFTLESACNDLPFLAPSALVRLKSLLFRAAGSGRLSARGVERVPTCFSYDLAADCLIINGWTHVRIHKRWFDRSELLFPHCPDQYFIILQGRVDMKM